MFKLAIAATAAVALAQNPAQPAWPKEFQAELTVQDFRTNRTEMSDYSFSVTNLGTQDDYTRFRNITWVTYRDYKAQEMYDVIEVPGNPQCRSMPLRGQLPIPNVNTFVYNGTVTLNDGTKAYRWNDPQYPEIEYLCTADANEYPIAFYDRRNQVANEYRNYKPVTTWPNGFWTIPAHCRP